MANPLVSVIIVVRNGERFLPDAVRAVSKQEYRPVEIIVVDGQSVDGTAKIAKAIKGVYYIYQQDNGLANARNCGIRASVGEFIAFLDSDDIWAPNKLRKQIHYLISHPKIQATVTWLRTVLELEFTLQNDTVDHFYRSDKIGYTPSALVARRDLFDRIGLFDPAYSLGCDADWFARLVDSKLPIAILPDVLLNKRLHGANISLDMAQARKETMLLLRNSLNRKRNNGMKDV